MEDSSILEKIRRIAYDNSDNTEISVVLTKENLKELMEEINKQYLHKSIIQENKIAIEFELQQLGIDFDDIKECNLNMCTRQYYERQTYKKLLEGSEK